MSIRIYAVEYLHPVSNETLHPLLATLPQDMADKMQRYRRWQDAYGFLFGKLLLTAALQQDGIPFSLPKLQYTEYGRPYLPDGPDFNISHSGHRTACIIASRGKAGIDIEEIKELDITDFKSQFSPGEWSLITHAANPLNAFYHYWTAKECLSKADGRGLNLPLASLKIEHNVPIRLNDCQWYLRALPYFSGYACHIAAERPFEELSLKELNANDILINALENHRNYPT